MTSSTHGEERLSSIASLSSPLSLHPGTLDLPNNSDLFNIEIITTSDPTPSDFQPSSSTNTQFLSSNLKTRHSPTPPPTNLRVTNDNVAYTVPSKKKYNILEDPVFIDSGILPPLLQHLKNPSHTNTMTYKFLRNHPNFKLIFLLYT